jgi:hypothetical protein
MLIDNIMFLRENYPHVRQYFLEHEKELENEHIKLLDTKSGMKTIQYDVGDKQLMVHSKYNPIHEAERIISSHEEKIFSDTHVFFYGVGMGYHIEKFLERYPTNSYSLYEPLPEVFQVLAEEKSLNVIFTKNIRNLYVGTNEERGDHLKEFITTNKNIHIIVLPSYENIITDKLTNFRKQLKEVILNRRSSLHTNVTFQKRWVMNSILNFDTVINTPNMLKHIDRSYFEGKPVIIVSAGPSLSEDIEHIRYIKENNLAFIFSVGSAINSLVEYDVLPDAVLTYDPSEKNHLVFKKMIENQIEHIPMVFGSSVGYETIRKYKGPKVHFITSQDRTSLYFLQEQLDLTQDLTLDSPSIAVMTFQLLNKLGADPIIFAGQNLGYLYDRRYSEGIEYEHIKSALDDNEIEKAITTVDVYGNEIKTNIAFNSMRESIERYVEVFSHSTFINTTKGGAAIKGVPFQTIENVINEVLTKPINKDKWWESEKTYDTSKIDELKIVLESSKNEFYTLLNRIEKVLESISLYTKLRNKGNLEMSLSQFDVLYNTIMENSYYKSFLSFYMRVEVELVGREIGRLNGVRDIIVKGKEVVSLFNGFLEKCRMNSEEIENLFIKSFDHIG